MRIKELEKLHPAAFQLAKEEVTKVRSWEWCYDFNEFLSGLFNWVSTTQGKSIWANIHFRHNFEPMNEWIRANRPDLIDLIPK